MTRDQAVKIWMTFGSSRCDSYNRRRVPQHIADTLMMLNAEDCIDGLIALKLLVVDQPSPQENTESNDT